MAIFFLSPAPNLQIYDNCRPFFRRNFSVQKPTFRYYFSSTASIACAQSRLFSFDLGEKEKKEHFPGGKRRKFEALSFRNFFHRLFFHFDTRSSVSLPSSLRFSSSILFLFFFLFSSISCCSLSFLFLSSFPLSFLLLSPFFSLSALRIDERF